MNRVELAIVGAGPAGIAAAMAAAGSGASIALIDEAGAIGGQLRWRLTPTMDRDIGLNVSPGPGPTVAQQAGEVLASFSNVEIRPRTAVWGIFEENLLGLSADETVEELQAGSIILATGSTDITYPFPGWTLPGVLTARAVQIFIHVHRVLPGKRWAILGRTAEADELAADLERAGAEVIVQLEDNVTNLHASGANRLTHVELRDDVYEVDGLAIALGRQPDPELAQHAMAEIRFSRELGGFVPVTDDTGRTTVPDMFAVGDTAGIGTIPELVADGRLAGLIATGASSRSVEAARDQQARVASPGRQPALQRIRAAEVNG